MINRSFTYLCLMALLLVFSCGREEPEVDLHGQTVTIHLSSAGLQQTKAITPGDGIGPDGGGFIDDYMCFEAPSEGTLNLWVSSTSGNDNDVCVREGGNLHTYGCGTSTGRPVDANITLTDVNKGTVTIFPSGGSSRLYKIEYTYVGSIEGDNPATPDVTEKSYIGEITLAWDFGSAVLKGYYDATAAYYSNMGITPPAIGAEAVWSMTLNNLTIWSMGKGKWVYSDDPAPNGYFEWIGYYKHPPVDPYNWKDNLVILIAKNNDDKAIVAKYPGASATLTSSNEVEGIITFSGIDQGEYTVYAFGNTSGLWPMTTKNVDGSGAEYVVSEDGNAGLLGLTTKDQVENLRFTTMTRNTVGWEDASYATTAQKYDDGVLVKNDRMPMAARAALTVSAGHNGEAYLELIRPVAKVTAIVKNNTGEPLTLYNYKHTVHNINPTTGYVLPHDNDCIGASGNLLTNPNIKYAPYDVPIPVLLEGSQEYDWYVFPSNGPYTVCLQFTLFKGDAKEKTYTYNHLPIANWKGENIMSLGRNQHITVETRISKGLTVSFNFQVKPWETSSSTVEFD